MQLKELKLLSELIHNYGVKEINRIINSNVEFLNYLRQAENNVLYSEENNIQTFTNCTSSIFCLKEQILDYNLIKESLNSDKNNNQRIQNYINQSKIWFGKNNSKATIVNYAGMVISSNTAIDSIAVLDAKLVELLLGDASIYASKHNPILYVESEKGYAYVLGKKHKNKLEF